MITLSYDEGCEPFYSTNLSAGADLISKIDIEIPMFERVLIPTGVYIDAIDLEMLPDHYVPSLEIRPRSGLAWKHGVTVLNAPGTIDADYRDEIKVVLINFGAKTFKVTKGMKIAQMVDNATFQNPLLPKGSRRIGGFNSTGFNKNIEFTMESEDGDDNNKP